MKYDIVLHKETLYLHSWLSDLRYNESRRGVHGLLAVTNAAASICERARAPYPSRESVFDGGSDSRD